MISKSSNYLIAASDQITVAPDQGIIRDNTQSHLVGDQENPALMMTGGKGQVFGQGGNLILADFLLLLFRLVHQIIDPEGKAVDEDSGSSRGALQLFSKTEGDFGGLPAQTFPVLLVPKDALVHFRVDAGTGGNEKARGVDLLGLLLGKGGFAGAAAAGYEGDHAFLLLFLAATLNEGCKIFLLTNIRKTISSMFKPRLFLASLTRSPKMAMRSIISTGEETC